MRAAVAQAKPAPGGWPSTSGRQAVRGTAVGPSGRLGGGVIQETKRLQHSQPDLDLQTPVKKERPTDNSQFGLLSDELLLHILTYLVGQLRVSDLKFVLNPQQAAQVRLVYKRFLRLIDHLGFNPVLINLARPPDEDDFLSVERENQFSDYFGAFDAMSTYVLEHFPAKTWAYLALGRSATPLLGQLGRRCTGARLINMPLGQMSLTLAQDQEEWISNTKVRGFVFRHFEQFVAPEKLGGRTKVLVLDYGDSGKALYTTYHWLNAYYESKGGNIEVAVYSISKETPQGLREKPSEEFGENVSPLPRKHVTIAGPEIPGIDQLIDALFGGELKHLAIDLYESLAANELISKGTGPSAPKPQNFYRLLRLLKRAENTSLKK